MAFAGEPIFGQLPPAAAPSFAFEAPQTANMAPVPDAFAEGMHGASLWASIGAGMIDGAVLAEQLGTNGVFTTPPSAAELELSVFLAERQAAARATGGGVDADPDVMAALADEYGDHAPAEVVTANYAKHAGYSQKGNRGERLPHVRETRDDYKGVRAMSKQQKEAAQAPKKEAKEAKAIESARKSAERAAAREKKEIEREQRRRSRETPELTQQLKNQAAQDRRRNG